MLYLYESEAGYPCFCRLPCQTCRFVMFSIRIPRSSLFSSFAGSQDHETAAHWQDAHSTRMDNGYYRLEESNHDLLSRHKSLIKLSC